MRLFAPVLAATLCSRFIAGSACAMDAGKPTDWWSLKPLSRPSVPQINGAGATWVRNPIDAFVLAKQREQGLQFSPEADRRTLIRRLYFNLIGLPPSPEQTEAFMADGDPMAYERLIDRLLASEHYGERWARHWLDVVHYGDTHGYDKDKPRPHAWPYRDCVIRAFNADKPYSRFVQEQLSGDVLFPGTRNGIEALGFIAAGPWDLIGHMEVPETKTDGKVARNLDRDDMVANAMNTFASITVQCARCHDHKFDPVTQADYYRLQAVFAALDRADKQYFADPTLTQRFNELDHRQRLLNERERQIDKKLADAAGNELVKLDKRIAEANKAVQGKERAEFGYHSGIETSQAVTKWVQVDLGRNRLVDRVVLVPCYDDFNQIGDGFGFPVRYRVEVSEDVTFPSGKVALLHESKVDEPNPGLTEQVIPAFGAVVRYVRVTATKLAPRKNDFIFALAELRVLDGNGANQTRDAVVSALDSIEAPPRWRKSNLVDDIAPVSQGAGELAQLRARREALLASAGDAGTRNELATLKKELQDITAQLKKFPPPDVVYAGTVHFGSGNFKGTGSEGAKPRPIHLLKRGEVNSPGSEVGPGALACLTGLLGQFDLPPSHAEGERRAALARWLTDPRNPLTWRSIVNRVWQYHFGRGIVETPNDFGRMGAPPTHPELLDWLAVEFRDGGQSLKRLHRLILTSATYRQSSIPQPGNGAFAAGPSTLDADNRYYWRMNRRKLEAEALRDAVLLVSGKLDERMYGPGFQDFVIEKPEHSPHYQYDLYDPDDPKSHRRSIYRFIVRSQMQPFMTSLDCADPSIQVARRNESVSSLQALALLNNGFMVTMAKHFAGKLEAIGGGLEQQVERAFKEALGRPPSAQERDELVAYARQHELANACRVLFNLNEFLFVD